MSEDEPGGGDRGALPVVTQEASQNEDSEVNLTVQGQSIERRRWFEVGTGCGGEGGLGATPCTQIDAHAGET